MNLPVTNVTAGQFVPLRVLTVALMAMSGAVGAAVLWPQALVDQEILAGGLALAPALLLAHYRGWPKVSLLLAVGMIAIFAVHLGATFLPISLGGSFVILFVVGPYIAIALGGGWFGEVRRYQAELRATQLQLIQSEKLDSIGRMAAGVAHEVKNPLMTILTGVKLLSKRYASADETTRVVLQDMTDAVRRADRIIGELLSYSRARGLDVAPVDLNATIDKALLLVKHELDKAHITVTKELDASLPTLQLDEFKVQQVFINVFNNALHAMGHDGEIKVRTSLDGVGRGRQRGVRKTDGSAAGERAAVVHIEDSGPGIPEEHLRKIFDPFFTTKPGVGTGLGLSVSRQIVEMHGGTIEIGNREAGGARVTITFNTGVEPRTDGAPQ